MQQGAQAQDTIDVAQHARPGTASHRTAPQRCVGGWMDLTGFGGRADLLAQVQRSQVLAGELPAADGGFVGAVEVLAAAYEMATAGTFASTASEPPATDSIAANTASRHADLTADTAHSNVGTPPVSDNTCLVLVIAAPLLAVNPQTIGRIGDAAGRRKTTISQAVS